MAIIEETPVKVFGAADGIAVNFDHVPTFTLTDASHLTVLVDDEVSLDWTKTPAGITFNSPPSPGAIVILHRTTPDDQPSEVGGARVFNLASIEKSLDREARKSQEIKEAVDRSIKSPIGSIFRASRTIGIDSAGVAYDRTDQEEVAFLGFQNVLSRIASLEVAVESLGGDVTPPTIPEGALTYNGETLTYDDEILTYN